MRYMRIVVSRYGGPDVISIAEEEFPTPNADEALVKILAAGVSLPDVLAREGIHPETPRIPYTPGWDFVGTVERVGQNVNGFRPGQTVAAMPIHGCYAQYICLSARKLVSISPRLDAAEAVAVVLNYTTAYQMLHCCAKAQPGQRMLIHGAAGEVGTAMLELARLAHVQMFGTCSAEAADLVRDLGGFPIDYRREDFVAEIARHTQDGVDAVFDGIGGDNVWRSRDALREGGRVVVYGFQSKMRSGRLASGGGERHPLRESAALAELIIRNWFQPGRKKMTPFSIQWLMRLRPSWFRHDLLALFELLNEGKIKPVIAARLPLQDSRRAHEMLGEGGVIGKIVLVPNAM